MRLSVDVLSQQHSLVSLVVLGIPVRNNSRLMVGTTVYLSAFTSVSK